MLYKGSLFYDEMSEDERKKWRKRLVYEELVPANLISESDRFEFFGFCREWFSHYHLWENFRNLLKFYTEQNYTYEWIKHPDGSFVEEKGPKPLRHVLDRDETDLMIYCNSIRTFSEIRKEFSHLGEDELFGLLNRLKDVGLLYYGENDRRTISVLEAGKIKRME